MFFKENKKTIYCFRRFDYWIVIQFPFCFLKFEKGWLQC